VHEPIASFVCTQTLKSQAPLEGSVVDGSCLLVVTNVLHPQPAPLWEIWQQGDMEYLYLCIYYLTWWFKSLGVRVGNVFTTSFVSTNLNVCSGEILTQLQ
jgi:hypothetical protein